MGKIYSFHGVDNKVGTTMLSQCLAYDLASKLIDKDVLMLSLDTRLGNSYTCEETVSISHFYPELSSGVNLDLSILKHSEKKANLFYVNSKEEMLEEYAYSPELSKKLVESLKERFDVIIADTGSSLNSNLSLFGMLSSEEVFLVTNQSEKSIRRFELSKSLYEKLGLDFSAIYINMFRADDPYSKKYLSKRLDLPVDKFRELAFSKDGRMAEIQGKCLMEYSMSSFKRGINGLSKEIIGKL